MKTYSHSLYLGLFLTLFIANCSPTTTKKSNDKKTETLANSYSATFKASQNDGIIAQYKDRKIKLETVEKSSRQLQDMNTRIREFEMLLAYKHILGTLKDQTDSTPANVTFYVSQPQAALGDLLKLVELSEDSRIAPSFTEPQEDMNIIAELNGQQYKLKDLNLNHTTYIELQKKAFDEKIKQLSQIITYQEIKAAADANEQTATQYLQKNGLGTAEPVSDDEVRDYFKSINVRKEQINEQVFERYRSILTQKKQDLKVKKYVAQQLIKEPITVFLQKPEARLDIKNTQTAFTGPENSSVTMILFSDMMCEHCLALWQNIAKVEKQYGNNLRIGFHNFFIKNDRFGRFVAEASRCLQNQKPQLFWQFAKKMHSETEAFSESVVNNYAELVGADMTAFKTCLTNREAKDTVEADLKYAHSLGLRKVPTLIIGGKTFTGQSSFDDILNAVKENYVQPSKAGFFSQLWNKILFLFGLA